MIAPWLMLAATPERSTTLARGPWAGANITALGGRVAEENEMADLQGDPERIEAALTRLEELAARRSDMLDAYADATRPIESPVASALERLRVAAGGLQESLSRRGDRLEDAQVIDITDRLQARAWRADRSG